MLILNGDGAVGLKSDVIRARINEYLEVALVKAEQEGKIDYFRIEIFNHNGTLQMDIVYRDKFKVY